MGIRITQVDAFTERRFAGNPAAVCVLSEPADERWMQDVAAEMNLSETAFARRLARRLEIQPALVHSRERSRSLRSRHARDGPCPLGRRPSSSRRAGALRDAQRPLDRPAAVPTESSWISPPSRSPSRSLIRASSPSCNRFSGRPCSSPAGIASTFWSSSRAKNWSAACARTSARLEQFPVRGVIVTARSHSR